MPGNSTVERWLDNIKSGDDRSTVRGEDDQYRHADRRDEPIDPNFGKPPQALHIGSTSRHRAKPHERQKISQNVLPPQNENSGGSRSRAKPRGHNKGPLSRQQLPVSGNSPRNSYSEAAPQSNLPRPYSASVYGSYTSRSVPHCRTIPPEIAPVSYATTFSVTRPQRASASVASYQDTYVIPTLNHTVQESSSFPQQNRHRDAYPSSEGLAQGTVAQETQRVGFRTAEANNAYGRYLRSGGQLDSIGSGTGNFSRMGMSYGTW
ncbi:uncharacterized protein Bfra_009235 [Botrytis fragariae]|uniref:Uncharacterized protein n=1 Tax=Botrytis fragariae TaxID=1964551 RepID=A0A8H6ANN1_9HELO|nr:uncharacterized protein Bfra_009235 [Botrytis fragariae]KAF5870688.1 hypothetical protein Bfra_009235 [Botrytis fragariae]